MASTQKSKTRKPNGRPQIKSTHMRKVRAAPEDIDRWDAGHALAQKAATVPFNYALWVRSLLDRECQRLGVR